MTVKYQPLPALPPLNKSPDIIRVIGDDGAEAFIPFDPKNVDYQAYLAWLAAGNVPDPAA